MRGKYALTVWSNWNEEPRPAAIWLDELDSAEAAMQRQTANQSVVRVELCYFSYDGPVVRVEQMHRDANGLWRSTARK
jgi:hypothetical protein